MMESGKQRLLLALFKECAPDVFEACDLLSEPLVTNWKLIPNIHAQIQSIEGETTCENIHVALAVLDRLLVPVQLISNKIVKKPVGLRDAYSKEFGYDNPENINGWAEIMRPHYKNPRFAERIDKIAFEVYANLINTGDLQAKIPFCIPPAHPFENIQKDGILAKMVKSRISGMI